jgi:hypothetical protein
MLNAAVLRHNLLRDPKSKELSHPKSALHCTSQSIATGLAADDWVPPCRLIDAVAIADILRRTVCIAPSLCETPGETCFRAADIACQSLFKLSTVDCSVLKGRALALVLAKLDLDITKRQLVLFAILFS